MSAAQAGWHCGAGKGDTGRVLGAGGGSACREVLLRVWYLPALVICSYQGVATSCVKIRSFALHLQGGLDKSWAALWNRLLAASIQYLRGCFLPEGLQTGPLLGSLCSGGSLLDYSR